MAEPQIAVLGSYPPRECGIATFTADVVTALEQHSVQSTTIIAIDEPGAVRIYPPNVIWRMQQHDPASYLNVAAAVGRSNVKLVNIQHEYGLFGGKDGQLLLTFMEDLPQPIITTLHTVLPDPSPYLREVTRALCKLSAEVVVLARSAIPILHDSYGVDTSRITFISHGIPTVVRQVGMRHAMKARLGYSGRVLLSTFGLINPDKGIEYVLQALPPLIERHPDLLFLVLGETHPRIRLHSGERYREGLQAIVDDLGLHDYVRFENRYLDLDELVNYLIATDIYLMAYLNLNQIVSGTLAYAVGCGKAAIATPFRYAEEMLADGLGIIVPFRSHQGIADALQRLLASPVLRAEMESRAYNFSRFMEWPSVAAAYQAIFLRVVHGQSPRLGSADAKSDTQFIVPTEHTETACGGNGGTGAAAYSSTARAACPRLRCPWHGASGTGGSPVRSVTSPGCLSGQPALRFSTP